MSTPYKHTMTITRIQEIQVDVGICPDYHDVVDVYAVDLKTLEKAKLTDDEHEFILKEAPDSFKRAVQDGKDEHRMAQWEEDRCRESD